MITASQHTQRFESELAFLEEMCPFTQEIVTWFRENLAPINDTLIRWRAELEAPKQLNDALQDIENPDSEA